MTESEGRLATYPFLQVRNFTIWGSSIFAMDSEKQLKLLREMKTKDNDVLLCTAPKSGTHLAHEILSMLLSQTSEYNSKGSMLDMYLEYQEPEVIEAAMENRRLMISHLPLSLLPIQHQEKGRKIVYVNRNPKVPEKWEWSEYFNKHVLTDVGHEFDAVYTQHVPYIYSIFSHEKAKIAIVKTGLTPYKLDFTLYINVINEFLKHPKVQIQRLAEFLDVPHTDEFINTIVNKCQFDNLRANKMDNTRIFSQDGNSTIYRKGVIGDWKNWFTVAQNEQFDAIYSKEMENVDVTFTFE